MLPPEVTKFIGKPGEARTLEVEKGAIKRLVEAEDDPNPLYNDEDYAKKSKFGGIIAPPAFFGWPIKTVKGGGPTAPELRQALVDIGYKNPAPVNAGEEYDFFRPVRSGDILTAVPSIKDISEREGKTGKMVFIISETTYANQKGELVAKARGIMMYR